MGVERNDGFPGQGKSVIKEQPAFDKQLLASLVKSAVDKYQFIPEFLKVRGLVKQQVDSFNYFVNVGVKRILKANNRIELLGISPLYLLFRDVGIGRASMSVDGVEAELTPQQRRVSDMTYSAPILVDVEYTIERLGEEVKIRKNNVVIGRMPIMLRSCRCILKGKDEAELAKLGECPLDPGGYFIVSGAEKVLEIQEQLSKNRIIIETDMKGRVTASVQCSKVKWQSKTVLVMDKENIYLELSKFKQLIPIMVVMKAMGMESDQKVLQMIGRFCIW